MCTHTQCVCTIRRCEGGFLREVMFKRPEKKESMFYLE